MVCYCMKTNKPKNKTSSGGIRAEEPQAGIQPQTEGREGWLRLRTSLRISRGRWWRTRARPFPLILLQRSPDAGGRVHQIRIDQQNLCWDWKQLIRSLSSRPRLFTGGPRSNVCVARPPEAASPAATSLLSARATSPPPPTDALIAWDPVFW